MIKLRHFCFALFASTALAAPAMASPSFQYAPGDFPSIGDILRLTYTAYTIEDTGVTLGNSSGNETTWGMGSVTDIYDVTKGGGPIWAGQNLNAQGVALDFVIYGIADDSASATNPVQLLNSGCTAGAGNGSTLAGCNGKIHVDFYLESNPDPALANSTTPANRTGFGTVAGITDVGTPFMDWTLTPGDINDTGDLTTTLVQDVDQDLLPTDGSGKFLANCVSGPGCVYFGNKSEDLNLLSGLFADFESNFTLQTPSDLGFGSTFPDGFLGDATGQAFTVSVVPEPGSVALIGSGLLGLFGAARRGKRKQS